MADNMADNNALSLVWAFGFSRDAGVHNLCDANRSALFYASAHTGVIYDLISKTQLLLQGHCNGISATAASADRRRVATADAGPESMLVLWNSYTGQPIRSITSPHPGGVRAMDLSDDARYVATLSDGPGPQVLSVWDMEAEGDAPLLSAQIGSEAAPAETQRAVRFRRDKPTELVTNGTSLVVFWSWVGGELEHYAPPLADASLKQSAGAIAATCFLPGKGALSVTAEGNAIVWDVADDPELPDVVSMERRATKLLKLHAGAILCVETAGELLVTGGADGHVRMYSFDLVRPLPSLTPHPHP